MSGQAGNLREILKADKAFLLKKYLICLFGSIPCAFILYAIFCSYINYSVPFPYFEPFFIFMLWLNIFIIFFYIFLRKGCFGNIGSSTSNPYNFLFQYKNLTFIHCICPFCFSTISLQTSSGEKWTCNYCGKEFSGSILQECPFCSTEQRAFKCSVCGKIIDINAPYDEEKIIRMRDEKQTEIIQRENKY